MSTEATGYQPRSRRGPLLAAGTMLGVGLGGFLDGIVLHQLLQVHNMVSAKHPIVGIDPESALVNAEVNMFWDGLFHLFSWMCTVVGVALLWRATRMPEVSHSTQSFLGSIVFGWGLFNLLEGLINHHVLHIHHVVEQYGLSGWDYGFLATGVLMVLAGIAAITNANEAAGMVRRR